MEPMIFWAVEQLERMVDANRQLAWLLEELEQAVRLPLLRETLAEQRRVNQRQQERFARMFALLEREPGVAVNPVIRAMVAEAREAERALREGPSRDTAVAQLALRIEHWELGTYRGLASLFRLLLEHGVADELDGLVDDLERAERHLASVGPALSGDEEVAHRHRRTVRHHPRSPIAVGPVE